MQEVRLHLASTGEVWAMTKCMVCGDIDKFPLARAMESPVPCKKCGHHMDIRHASIEAADGRSDIDLDRMRSTGL
jgi:RNase P subunit RPR2